MYFRVLTRFSASILGHPFILFLVENFPLTLGRGGGKSSSLWDMVTLHNLACVKVFHNLFGLNSFYILVLFIYLFWNKQLLGSPHMDYVLPWTLSSSPSPILCFYVFIFSCLSLEFENTAYPKGMFNKNLLHK